MINIETEVKGTKEAVVSIDNLARDGVSIARGIGLRRLVEGREFIRWYPPQIPGQKYKRTGIYGKSWEIEGDDDEIRLYSAARQHGRVYSRYVAGWPDGTGQAQIHAGRWRKSISLLQRITSGIEQEISDEIILRARRKGMQG